MKTSSKKQGPIETRNKASSHLCDKRMRSYEKKLLFWPPTKRDTKFGVKNWVIFHVFLKISPHRRWNQKKSPVAERLDPWCCFLEVKSSWVDFGGWGGAVKSSGYFGLNVVIFPIFYFSGRDIFTIECSWPLRWQGTLLEKPKSLKFVISVTLKQHFFQERHFWENTWIFDPQVKFFISKINKINLWRWND